MEVSVIISYYKALDNLKLVLSGLERQSDMRFEAIISEDDRNSETKNFIEQHASDYSFPIIHVDQEENLGFRKTMMLNKSVKISTSAFLVFIDGDCIPSKHFVREYVRNAKKGHMHIGRRVMLGQQYSESLLKEQSVHSINFWSLLLSDSSKIKEAIYSPKIRISYKTRGLLGCNWGIMKEHLLAINGYDEDYNLPAAGEDNDVEWRLEANGISKVSIKNRAIVYHIYHPRSYFADSIKIITQLLEDKMNAGIVRCLNGLEKLATNQTNSQ